MTVCDADDRTTLSEIGVGQRPLTGALATRATRWLLGSFVTAALVVGTGCGTVLDPDVENLVFVTESLPTGAPGVPYSASLVATGGDGTHSWSVVSGSLPDGLALSASGEISGTPTGPDGTFTARVASGDGQSVTRALTITVNDPLAVTPTTWPTGISGAPYGPVSLVVTGGAPAFAWSVSEGVLPAGLTLTGDGTVSGIPTQAGVEDFRLDVSAGDGQAASVPGTISVYAPLAIDTDQLPGTVVGDAYDSGALVANGGLGPYAWSLSNGNLPTGLSLTPDGVIQGVATAPADSFEVTVTSADGQEAQKTLHIGVVHPQVVIVTGQLPNGAPTVPYSAAVVASGGVAPYAWSVSAGSLPAGLSLSQDGVLSGEPQGATETFTLTVVSSDGQQATRDFTLTVNAALQATSIVPPSAVVGDSYGPVALEATGGDGQYSWSGDAATLPPGIAVQGASLGGVATTAGTFVFAVDVTSGDGQVDQMTLTLEVYPVLTLDPRVFPAAYLDHPYGPESLTSAGGEPTRTWSVSAGQLPTGLTLSNDGQISGAPTVVGSYDFTVRVESGTQSVEQQYTLDVVPGPFLLSPQTISLNTAIGDPNPAPETVVISDGASASVPWQAQASESWLSVDPVSGTLTTPTDDIVVEVDLSTLSGGSHLAFVIVTDPVTGWADSVAVHVVVDPAPVARPLAVTHGVEVFLSTVTGNDRVQLTERDSLHVRWVEWSPTGEELAFLGSPPNGVPQLWVMSADGSNKRQLSNTPFAVQPFASWSPDGQRLLFYYQGSTFVINRDGTGLQDLTPPGGFMSTATWSPDGQWIAYQGQEADGRTGIFRMRANGSQRTWLFQMGWASDKVIRYAPAGGLIAFDHFTEIYVIGEDGSNPTALTNSPGSGDKYPVWSPDGTRLAFQTDGGSYFDVAVMEVATGTIVAQKGHQSIDDAEWPAWSPDGSMIAFKMGADIFVGASTGSGWQYSTDGVFVSWHPGK